MRCSHCWQWHPAETSASGSATDYAERMLFIRCDTARFFVGTIGAQARDPKAVKFPLELELWRVCSQTGRPLFSRRCTSEDETRYVDHVAIDVPAASQS